VFLPVTPKPTKGVKGQKEFFIALLWKLAL